MPAHPAAPVLPPHPPGDSTPGWYGTCLQYVEPIVRSSNFSSPPAAVLRHMTRALKQQGPGCQPPGGLQLLRAQAQVRAGGHSGLPEVHWWLPCGLACWPKAAMFVMYPAKYHTTA